MSDLTYGREKAQNDIQRHVAVGCVADGRGQLEQHVAGFRVGIFVKVVLQETEESGDLGRNELLFLPEQDAIQREVWRQQLWRVADDLAFFLVKELPGLGLAGLSNTSASRAHGKRILDVAYLGAEASLVASLTAEKTSVSGRRVVERNLF
jgi:hypothetical protein